jgi:ABC-type glutathione transport system ATPase component
MDIVLVAGFRKKVMAEPVIHCEELSKQFDTGNFWASKDNVLAVAGVTLDVLPGETLGIVGESGSGKSTLLRMMLRLIRPTNGRVLFEGEDLRHFSGNRLRGLRRRMQPVFQDPKSSFNPRQSVEASLSAPLEVHNIGARKEQLSRVSEVLELVGLDTQLSSRYPHQLSGGQLQRAAIARAIILRPALILADEPTSALDVSVQAQILNLFKRTKSELGLTCVFVSHNLGVIRYVSDRVAVMYRGRIVEMNTAHDIFTRPQHEYTRALLAAVPGETQTFTTVETTK